jgi:hypothetical protein
MILPNRLHAALTLFLAFLFVSAIPCVGQIPEFEWVNHVSGPAAVSGGQITTDDQKITTSGIMNGQVTLDSSGTSILHQSSFNSSPFIYQLGGNGLFSGSGYADVYASSSPGLCSASDKDRNGYVFADLNLLTEWDIDPGPNELLIELTGDLVVLKFDSAGSVLWAKVVTGGEGWLWDEPRDIAIDSDGNVFSCGWFNGAPDFDPGPDTLIIEGASSGFIHKMDSDGNLLWAGKIGEAGEANGMVLDSAGFVYLAGTYQATVDIDPGPDTLILESVLGGTDTYAMKLDPAGNAIWAVDIGGNGLQLSHSITLLPTGNILISGTFKDTLNTYPGGQLVPLVSHGKEDIFIYELSADGDFQNAWRIGGPESDGGNSALRATKVTTDPVGNIYLSGRINTGYPALNTDMDPGPDTTWSQDLGIVHYFIAKYDSDMNLIWAIPGNGASDFAVGSNQEVYITGTFTDTIDLDPGPVQEILISEGGSDMYVLKLNQDSLLTTQQPSFSVGELKVSVYPNPSTGSYTIEVPEMHGKLDYSISDLAGRVVETGAAQHSRFDVAFNARPGIYLLSLRSENDHSVVRLVKE